MSIAFFDGFETSMIDGNGNMNSHWTYNSGWTTTASYVRHGSLGVSYYANPTGQMRKDFSSLSASTWIVGFAWNQVNSVYYDGISHYYEKFIEFWEGSTIKHASIGFNGNAQFVLYNSSNTVLWTDSVARYSVNTWYFWEFKLTVDSSNGSLTIYRDGEYQANVSGLNTRNGGSGVINAIAVWSARNFKVTAIDDLYMIVCDGVGQNNFLGEVRIDPLYPQSDANVAWGRNAGSNNFGRLAETTGYDGDTSYIYTQNTSVKDLYGAANVPYTNGTVIAIGTKATARKDDIGTKTFKMTIKPSSTEFDSDTKQVFANQTYGTFSYFWETNPESSFNWTIGDVNNITIGIKT